MKIAFFEMFEGEKDVLEKSFSSEGVYYSMEKLNKETVKQIPDAEVVSVFVGSRVSKEIIDALPQLKFINTSSTGFDHIDLNYCKEKGIKVSNVPSYGSVTVAEFSFALILALSRKICNAHDHLQERADFNVFAPLKGFDLRGKTIGVIGTGKIGRNVIKIAKGFGMNVIACNNSIDKAFEAEMQFTYKSFEEVVAEADILTLHVPFSQANFHMINKDSVAKMKKGVYLINTARGELVDTNALVWGLKEGIIAGAGLDVLEGERVLKEETDILASPERAEAIAKDYKVVLEDHVLIGMPNVVVTPHIAFYSKEAEGEIIRVTIDNIEKFISGNALNLVSK